MWILSYTLVLKDQKAQLLGFDPQTSHDNDLNLKHSKHIKLFHNNDKTLFIICYNHYLSKILELENQVPKLRFQI